MISWKSISPTSDTLGTPFPRTVNRGTQLMYPGRKSDLPSQRWLKTRSGVYTACKEYLPSRVVHWDARRNVHWAKCNLNTSPWWIDLRWGWPVRTVKQELKRKRGALRGKICCLECPIESCKGGGRLSPLRMVWAIQTIISPLKRWSQATRLILNDYNLVSSLT